MKFSASDVINPRSPDIVCRLKRMGSAFPSRLSFIRILVERMSLEKWTIKRAHFELDIDGYGTAVYTIKTPVRVYSLIAFAQHLSDSDRTDRVIASAWDSAFVLFDGVPCDKDIKRLREEAPKQESGRFESTDLVISRANKSVRIFNYVCDCLAKGIQPDLDKLVSVGYLMRTTAVYGNGKFGISDRSRIEDRVETEASFQIEMLTVYMIRNFTFDQVEHIATMRNPEASVKLDKPIKRSLGVGNSTGLGMAPFIVSHPELLHSWISAREVALVRVREMKQINVCSVERAKNLLERAKKHVLQWNIEHDEYANRNTILLRELEEISKFISNDDLMSKSDRPWDSLYQFAESELGLDCQELLVSLLIELYPECSEDLASTFSDSEMRDIDVTGSIEQLKKLLDNQYSWTDQFDFSKPEETEHFWYTSANKLEPRYGRRSTDPGSEHEMPVTIARDMASLRSQLCFEDPAESVASFLGKKPQFRHLVRRAQNLSEKPFGEIRDNVIGLDCLPLDMLRFKLAYFGAVKFDPKSSLWTRITLFQGAPLYDELTQPGANDFWLAAT